jgi:predicted metal-binding membrane protein
MIIGHGSPMRSGVRNRDRIVVLSALAGVTALAWVYLLSMSTQMDPPAQMEMLQVRPWNRVDFGLIFLMWTIMMVGMMVPTAAPMTLTYAAVARKAARNQTSVAPTMAFASGYVVLWTFFSVLAALAQWGLDQAAVLSPMMVATSPALGGGLLIVAGTYQLTPFKRACLDQCRSPIHFLASQWRPGVGGAFRMGIVHGAVCVGCCWALMGLLFVGGVMNLLWVAAIAFFVLLEKVMPQGQMTSAVAGGALIVIGVAALAFA